MRPRGLAVHDLGHAVGIAQSLEGENASRQPRRPGTGGAEDGRGRRAQPMTVDNLDLCCLDQSVGGRADTPLDTRADRVAGRPLTDPDARQAMEKVRGSGKAAKLAQAALAATLL